jgi:hypothetical protein
MTKGSDKSSPSEATPDEEYTEDGAHWTRHGDTWSRSLSPAEAEQIRAALAEEAERERDRERERRIIDRALGAPLALAREMEKIRRLLEASHTTPAPKPAPTPRKPQRSPQADLARRAIAALYPSGVTDADMTEAVTGKIAAWLETEGARKPYPSWKTVARVLGRQR